MSLTLTKNPVTTEGGIIKNIFPGYRPVEYEFKREDLQITSIGESGGNIEITIGVDLTTYLSPGDYIYLSSPGISGTFDYDLVAEILNVTATTIELDSLFIEGAASGYINYFLNYYVEVELVGVENVNRKILPFNLINDGDQAGNITIDVSVANDKNRQMFEFLTQEETAGRLKFNVRYRQVYDGSAESFTEINDPVILVYAWEQMETDEIINSFDLPKLYKGYDFGVIASHSDQNGTNSFVALDYDELNINQIEVSSANAIGQLDIDLFGMLFYHIPKSTIFDNTTEYVRINGSYTNLPDYMAGDYADVEYKTT